MEHVTRWGNPQRPPACPCVWSDGLVLEHWHAIFQEDLDLALHVSILLGLWGTSTE